MQIIDIAEETFFSLSSNKSRSSLTILGIVIGIASVIAMMSVGQGAARNIEQNIQSLGSNLLVVMPGSSRSFGSSARGGMGSATTLNLYDVEAIRSSIANIESVSAQTSSREQASAKGANTNTSIYGVEPEYAEIRNIEMELGSFITSEQNKRISRVAVLGPDTRDTLFGESSDAIGEKVKINGKEFTVIGITKSKGGTGFGSSDDLVYIPVFAAKQYFTGNNAVSSIYIQVSSADLMTTVQNEITSLLLSRHNIKDSTKADFNIMNQADIMETMSSVTGTMTLLLASIGGISLLVGGIGIMNMMLTTVTERTREIGLRKSLGAKDKDIVVQFLSESVALTFIGGVIGILVGWGISYLISIFGDTTTAITAFSVFLAVGVSAFIGIIFGFYPAKRASKLDPINALRYE